MTINFKFIFQQGEGHLPLELEIWLISRREMISSHRFHVINYTPDPLASNLLFVTFLHVLMIPYYIVGTCVYASCCRRYIMLISSPSWFSTDNLPIQPIAYTGPIYSFSLFTLLTLH